MFVVVDQLAKKLHFGDVDMLQQMDELLAEIGGG